MNEASIGLNSKATVEQSDCFVFKDGKLITYNDSIMVKCDSPLPGINAVVKASDFMGMLSKMPDDEIELVLRDNEIRIRGTGRASGIATAAEVALPFGGVPEPEGWSPLAETALSTLQQAARTCGNNDAEYLCTCVHITPTRIQASDNFRLFRMDRKTGFPKEVLVPADNIAALEGLEIKKVSVGEGWVHWLTASGAVVSTRCSHEPYHANIDDALCMDKPEKIVLPATLKEMVERADVFNTATHDFKVGIRIAANELAIKSNKEGAWYRERKGIEYKGRPLEFHISPKFLVEVLEKTREVLVDSAKMKITNEGMVFVVSLVMKTEDEKE